MLNANIVIANNEQKTGINNVRNGLLPCEIPRPNSTITVNIVKDKETSPTRVETTINLIATSSNWRLENTKKQKQDRLKISV